MARSVALSLGALAITLAWSAPLLAAGHGTEAPLNPPTQPIATLAAAHGHHFPVDPAPEGLSVEDATAYWTTERPLLGRTATDWTTWAESLPDDPAEPVRVDADRADLVEDVLRIHRAVGLPPAPELPVTLAIEAAGLAQELVAPFAALVDAVADAYEAQDALARPLLDRFPQTFDIREPFLAQHERDATAARGEAILAALATFEAQVTGLAPAELASPAGTPIFSDPEGLVVLAGPGSDVHERAGPLPDPVLLVDLGGNDLYLNSAGGADPTGALPGGISLGIGTVLQGNGLVLSVVADLAGDDAYTYVGAPAVVQGAGAIGALGILWDAAGADHYTTDMRRGADAPFPVTYFDGGAQGYGYGGVGLLVDLAEERDTYELVIESTFGYGQWGFAQGFGAAGGLGVLTDQGGADRYLATGLDIPFSRPGTQSRSFLGLYTAGSGFFGGVGLLVDAGPEGDEYISELSGSTTDYYAQAFGAFGGLGILADRGGDDLYWSRETADDPFIRPVLNCAYGTASAGGFGIFLDADGDDTYYGDTVSPYTAATMNEGFGGIGVGVGVFWDVRGDDEHVMEAHGGTGSIVMGRGEVITSRIVDNLFLGEGGNVVGLYLDSGGVDTYVGPGQENDVWPTGADLAIVP